MCSTKSIHNKHITQVGILLRQLGTVFLFTFVKATISGRHVEDVILLPRNVLRSDNEIWSVGENNLLERNMVSLLRADEDYVYVSTGLSDGQLICKTLINNPMPGMRIRYDNIPGPDTGVDTR